MSKHTPGPWEIKFGVNVFGSNGRLVANCGGTQDSKRVSETAAENEANARLIAAAPELLEALLEIKRLIDEYAIVRRDGCLMGTAEAVSVGFVFERIDAAIAKATGAD